MDKMQRILYQRRITESHFKNKFNTLEKYGFMTDRDIGDVAQLVPVSDEVGEMYDEVYEKAYLQGMKDALVNKEML